MEHRISALVLSFITLSVLPASSLALDQASADALASHVLGQLGRAGGGIVSLPAESDGMLSRAILQSSRLWVHAMASDTAGVRKVMAVVEPTGQVGCRAWVETGSPSSLPCADNLVDLVVVTNLTDASVSGVSADEILRCLNPGGMAFVGRASAEGAGLGAAALTSWVAGRPGWVISTDAQGTWAVLTKPRPAGADEWTHATHTPDNNPVSADSSIKWPYLPQWRMKPYATTRYGAAVTSNGRLYMALNVMTGGIRSYLVLYAHRLSNGCTLWSKTIQESSMGESVAQNVRPIGASDIVAVPEGVYVVQRNQVVLFDGETGARVDSIAMSPTVDVAVKWIAVSGGLLYGLIGDSTWFDQMFSGAAGSPDSLFFRHGTEIAAYDLTTRTEVWRKTLGARVDSREIGISGGKLYYHARGERVGCVDAATGDSIWSNSDVAVLSTLEENPRDGGWPTFPAPGMLCSPYGLFLCTPEDQTMYAFSPADGHVLWTATAGTWERMTPKFILGTTLVNKSVDEATYRYVNVQTGQPTSTLSGFDQGMGCGPKAASPDGVFGNSGGQACSYSLNRNLAIQPYKTDCGIGAVLSDGMYVYPSTGCLCAYVRGSAACRSAGDFEFDRAAVQDERLEQGPAIGDLDRQVTVTAQDWWTYRANGTHASSLPVNVPTSPHLICSYRPAHPYDSSWAQSCGGSADGAFDDRPDAHPSAPVTALRRPSATGARTSAPRTATCTVWKHTPGVSSGGSVRRRLTCVSTCMGTSPAHGLSTAASRSPERRSSSPQDSWTTTVLTCTDSTPSPARSNGRTTRRARHTMPRTT